jgi:L-cysteine/cystine lyase
VTDRGGGGGTYDRPVVSPFMPDAEKVAAIRELLPATAAGIYLNAGTAGPMPAETQLAMDEQAARELAVGRASPDQLEDLKQRWAELRASIAAVIVGDPDDIAMTHSTTDGLNLAINALAWGPGDRVVTTRHEHPGAFGPLLALRERVGVEIDVVDIGEGGEVDRTREAFRTALERPARAVVTSHVLWTTGAVLPIRDISELARAAGSAVIVDGAQSAGAIPIDVEALGVDAYAIPGQKWLLGPEGMGALWARRAWADAVVPASAGFISYAEFDTVRPRLHPGARRFELGFFHRPSVVGLARSCGWLTMYVGLPWAQARAADLARAAADRLNAIDGVTILTPTDAMGTLVTFRVAGWPAADAVRELSARTFAITRDIPSLDAIRISVGFWNTDEELDRFARGVELLAAHDPASIPPRRTLAVLGSDDSPLR